MDSEFDRKCELELERQEIAKCAHEKKDEKDCDMCTEKFKCKTMRLKRYCITEERNVCTSYFVYAENKEDARNVYHDFFGEDFIEEGRTKDYGGETDVEELDD